MCLLMWEGMACGGLPFPGTGCPKPDVDNLCLLCIGFYVCSAFYVWNAVSILTTSIGCFFPRILLFEQRTEHVAMDLIYMLY